MAPTISYRDFQAQALKAREELEELLNIINLETLPLMAMHSFDEMQIPPLAAALDVLNVITKRVTKHGK